MAKERSEAVELSSRLSSGAVEEQLLLRWRENVVAVVRRAAKTWLRQQGLGTGRGGTTENGPARLLGRRALLVCGADALLRLGVRGRRRLLADTTTLARLSRGPSVIASILREGFEVWRQL